MSLQRIFPEPAGPWQLDEPSTRDVLAALYAPNSYAPTSALAETPAETGSVRINMVSSLNGSAVGDDGTSESLSSPVDRRILGVIREAADVVVVGARTLRREGYLSPRHSRLAVVTLSGDLTGHRLQDSPLPPLVLCPASAVARVREQLAGIPHDIAPLSSPTLDAGEILAALRERDLTDIVCEGGPTLAAAFLDAGVVDELCLTTAPRLRSPGTPLLARLASTPEARLTQLLVASDSSLYARWALPR